MEAPNAQLSKMLIMIVKTAVEEEKKEVLSECKSTEDMIATFKEFNASLGDQPGTKDDWIIGSMDMVGLYTHLHNEQDANLAG